MLAIIPVERRAYRGEQVWLKVRAPTRAAGQGSIKLPGAGKFEDRILVAQGNNDGIIIGILNDRVGVFVIHSIRASQSPRR